MEAPSDLPSLWLAAAFSDAIRNAIPHGASDDLCMDALRLAFVEFARSAIKDGTPRAALVLWAAMLLDDVESRGECRPAAARGHRCPAFLPV